MLKSSDGLKRLFKQAFYAVTLLLTATSCTTATKIEEPSVPRSFSSQTNYSESAPRQCKAMMDSYCNTLYSPEAQGNLEIKQGRTPSIEVMQGETHNEFTQVFYRYSKAKLRSRSALPEDFKLALDRNAYFAKLRSFINRSPRAGMSLAQRLENENTSYELSYIWSASLNEAIISRMAAKYRGFHRIPEANLPIELQLERRRLRRLLISEVSRAVWRDDKNWQRVELGFERLKTSFLRVINSWKSNLR